MPLSAEQTDRAKPSALLLCFAFVTAGLRRECAGGAYLRVYALKLRAQTLALVPESGQYILSVGHHHHVVDTDIASDAS